MTYDRRAKNYERQNGTPGRVTPRQLRRLVKKSRQAHRRELAQAGTR